jgi:hypothetical protein
MTDQEVLLTINVPVRAMTKVPPPEMEEFSAEAMMRGLTV